jgi:cytoskeletal protein CcmA (bactofilin family)
MMGRLKLLIGTLLVAATLLIGLTGLVRAQAFKSNDSGTVVAGQVVNEAIFVAAGNIKIAGTVNGDVFCAAQNVDITGTINGDVLCLARHLNIAGIVNGSARLIGQYVNITGSVKNSVSSAGLKMTVSRTGSIGQDLQSAGSDLVIGGVVKRDLASSSRTITINGVIGRNVNVNVNSLNISPIARIKGNLRYQSANKAKIAQGVVSGITTRLTARQYRHSRLALIFILTYIYGFIGFLIIALLTTVLFPKLLLTAVRQASQQPIKTAIIGLVSVVIIPILLIILMITIIGLPLAVLLWMIYVLMLMLSGPFFVYLIGSKLMPEQKAWVQTLLGSLVLLVAFVVPLLNILAGLATVVFGSGMIINLLKNRGVRLLNFKN